MGDNGKKSSLVKLCNISVYLEKGKSSGANLPTNINYIVWSQKGLYELIKQVRREEVRLEDPYSLRLIDLAESLSGPSKKFEQAVKQIQVQKPSPSSISLPTAKQQAGGDPALAVAIVMGFLLDYLKVKTRKK